MTLKTLELGSDEPRKKIIIAAKDIDKPLWRATRANVYDYARVRNAFSLYREVKANADVWTEADKHIHFSRGNVKTGELWSYSTVPLLTCMQHGTAPKCATCGICYALKDMIYTQVRTNEVYNTVLIQKYPSVFREELALLNSKGKLHRGHVEGDLVNTFELDSINECVTTPFLNFTKRYDMVARYFRDHVLNDQLHLLISEDVEGKGKREMYNPYNLPVFHICPTVRSYLNAHCDHMCGSIRELKSGDFEFTLGNCKHCMENHCGCFAAKRGEIVGCLAH